MTSSLVSAWRLAARGACRPVPSSSHSRYCALSTSSVRRSSSCGTAKPGVPYDYAASLDKAPSTAEVPDSADAVVIGGGAAGCSALYHLAKLGMTNVVLLERSKLTAGTTWHSAGLVWRLRAPEVTMEALKVTRDLLVDPSEDGLNVASTGVDPGWKQNGSMFPARTEDRLQTWRALMTFGQCFGIESRIVSPAEIKELYPHLRVDDLCGALYTPGDGVVEPSGIAEAYGRAAVKRGAKIVEDCMVTAIQTQTGFNESRQVSAVHTDRGVIKTNCVVNCAGAWAPSVGQLAGVQVPLLPVRHAYVVTEAIDGIRDVPNLHEWDTAMYVKTQGDALVFGGYESNPIIIDKLPSDFNFGLYDLDWDVFSPHLNSAIHRIPCLEKTGIKSTVCGPESFTADHKPLLGEAPELRGFYLSCGYNSAGIMLSGGCGKFIAEWVVHGRASVDTLPYDIRRFGNSYKGNPVWLRESNHEAVAAKNDVHYPIDEPLAARNFLKDPLHQELLEAGCMYQARHGWERPGWFATETVAAGKLPEVLPYDYCGEYGHTRHQDYTYYETLKNNYTLGFPACFEMIQAEGKACREKAALFNMSYFGKFLVAGKDARKAIDWLCTNNITSPDKLTYTCMLNKYGGTEADVTVGIVPESMLSVMENATGLATVANDGGEAFYVACGGAVATYVQEHMRRVVQDERFDARLIDVTTKLGILSVQGPRSQDILQSLTSSDLSVPGRRQYCKHFPLDIDGHRMWAMRMSYVGEFGYELHIPAATLLAVYRRLMSAGEGHGLRNAGFIALDYLSVEKGFHHWHGDLNSHDTPVEAGLGFLCSKSKDYLGKGVVEQQRSTGTTRQRICLVTEDSGHLLHGNEAVWCDGKVVDFVRRAGVSMTTRQGLAYAYVGKTTEETVDDGWLAGKKFEVEHMAVRLPARAYVKSPFA